ncbi:ABC transporter substrate-binding protein [Bradyrhizobium canariense]|uniref:Branched-chain amino acid transport system substrate-binding protein n=1 Tax=Bradyrhizobium canariense TaxID=255045 RepID=A0A1H1NSP4_9BRAD|nr:ABC transporter substrate-binding protein [Bradyrhizobium canariense]SDS01997.1 branched-chain amino acid transport system substrate-binding protein [Bradyrhizobium canariense]
MLARLKVLLLATCSFAASVGVAHAADQAPVHITVISDLDDDLYDARSGRGGVDATRMAVADFGGTVLGRPVIVDALNDHNKPAEAPGLATQAYDAGADLLMDVQNSPIALAIAKVANERHKLAISTGAAAPALTRGACSRYVYHYSFDLPAIETTTADYLAQTAQGKRWAFVSEDTGFGRAGIATMTALITVHGGQVVKSFVVPSTMSDYSTILDELRGLKPEVVAVIDAGAKDDAGVTAVTKAGLPAVTTTALLYLSDVDRVQGGYAGVVAATPWYWNLDAAARAWSDRFAAAHDGRRPTEAQAADYSATTQWLNAVRTAGTTDADAVVHALDGHKFNDFFAHDGEFRASDHAVVHDLYVVKVRTQAELPEPHAWYEVLATVPAATAFPVGTECKMAQ